MTPREILLQALEKADDNLIADLLAWLAERRSPMSGMLDSSFAGQVRPVDASTAEPVVGIGWAAKDRLTSLDNDSSPRSSFVAFFRNSPLCDVADEIDFSRDQSPVPDRVAL